MMHGWYGYGGWHMGMGWMGLAILVCLAVFVVVGWGLLQTWRHSSGCGSWRHRADSHSSSHDSTSRLGRLGESRRNQQRG